MIGSEDRRGFQRTGDIARDGLIDAIEEDLDSWDNRDDPYMDEGPYDNYKPSEVYCEVCGVWLGYNYPASWCRGCKPSSPPV